MFPDKADEVLLRQGAGEKEALEEVAVVLAEHLFHIFGFHAFHDGLFADTPDGAEGGLEEGHGRRFRHSFPEDIPVKLDQVHGIGQEGADGGEAGAVVIQAEGDAFRAHALHEGDHLFPFDTGGLGGFRDLQVDGVRVKAIFSHQAQQVVREGRIAQLAGREVDLDAMDAQAAGIPVPDQAADFLEHIQAHGVNPSVLLRNADQLLRIVEGPVAVPQADQSFRAAVGAAVHVQDRLVKDFEGPFFQGLVDEVQHLLLMAHGFQGHVHRLVRQGGGADVLRIGQVVQEGVAVGETLRDADRLDQG